MSKLAHDFTEPGLRKGISVLLCSHGGCTVAWRPDRQKPTGACRGRRPLEWDDFGSGQVPACSECFELLCQPFMAEAIASVGIETGGVDVRRMMNRYHADGHKEI